MPLIVLLSIRDFLLKQTDQKIQLRGISTSYIYILNVYSIWTYFIHIYYNYHMYNTCSANILSMISIYLYSCWAHWYLHTLLHQVQSKPIRFFPVAKCRLPEWLKLRVEWRWNVPKRTPVFHVFARTNKMYLCLAAIKQNTCFLFLEHLLLSISVGVSSPPDAPPGGGSG